MLFKHFVTVLGMAAMLGACDLPGPYIDRPYEFNREHEDFPYGSALEPGSEINVCYAKSSSTPEQIRQVANDECGRFGLVASLVKQSYTKCPLTTPTTATFECRPAPGTAVRAGTQRLGSPVMMPSAAAPRPAGIGRFDSGIGAADVSTTAKSEPFPTYLFNPTPEKP